MRWSLCWTGAPAPRIAQDLAQGGGGYRVTVTGRAAQPGPRTLRGSIRWRSRGHVLAIQALTDYAAGTTVNVGVIHGGTGSKASRSKPGARWIIG